MNYKSDMQHDNSVNNSENITMPTTIRKRNLKMTSSNSFNKANCMIIALLFFSAPTQAAVAWSIWNPNMVIDQSVTKENARSKQGANPQYRADNLCDIQRVLNQSCSHGDHANLMSSSKIDEFILLEFQTPISLKQLSADWPFSNDSPNKGATLMAFSASVQFPAFMPLNSSIKTPSGNSIDQRTKNLITDSWSLINNTENQINPANSTSMPDANNVTSSYWLAGIYNYFYFKQKSAPNNTNNTEVPLPITTILLGIGLLALGLKKLLFR